MRFPPPLTNGHSNPNLGNNGYSSSDEETALEEVPLNNRIPQDEELDNVGPDSPAKRVSLNVEQLWLALLSIQNVVVVSCYGEHSIILHPCQKSKELDKENYPNLSSSDDTHLIKETTIKPPVWIFNTLEMVTFQIWQEIIQGNSHLQECSCLISRQLQISLDGYTVTNFNHN